MDLMNQLMARNLAGASGGGGGSAAHLYEHNILFRTASSMTSASKGATGFTKVISTESTPFNKDTFFTYLRTNHNTNMKSLLANGIFKNGETSNIVAGVYAPSEYSAGVVWGITTSDGYTSMTTDKYYTIVDAVVQIS